MKVHRMMMVITIIMFMNTIPNNILHIDFYYWDCIASTAATIAVWLSLLIVFISASRSANLRITGTKMF